MCDIKVKDRFPSKELRGRLGIEDATLVLQQKQAVMVLARVAKKDEGVKKCMEYEVGGPRPRGRPKRTWITDVEKDCQAHKLNKDDAVDRSRSRNLIKDV